MVDAIAELLADEDAVRARLPDLQTKPAEREGEDSAPAIEDKEPAPAVDASLEAAPAVAEE